MFAYFTASGGCFGLEPAVYGAGPAVALIFIAIIPFATSLPMALISSEMCSIYPEEGSTILWCDDIYQLTKQYSNSNFKKIISWCFSQFNANTLFLKAYFNTAVYSSLCFNYIASWAPVLNENVGYKVAIGLGLNLIVFILSLRSLKVTGNLQYIFAAVTITPIIIALICGAIDANPDNLQFNRSFSQIDWQILLSTIIWNTTGLDQVTNVSSQVKNPSRTYPIALSIVTIIIDLSYFIPCLCFCLGTVDIEGWNQGFVSVVDQFPSGQQGHWLKILVSIAAIVAVFSLLNNQITCAIRELHKSGEKGRIPIFSRFYEDKFSCKQKLSKQYQEVPIFALVTITVVTTLMLFLDHDIIVSLDGYLIAFTAIIQVIAYIYCRHGEYSMKTIMEGLQDQEQFQKKDQFQLKRVWWCTTLIALLPLLANLFCVITGGWVYLLIFIGIQLVMFILQIIDLAIRKQLSTIIGTPTQLEYQTTAEEIQEKIENQENQIEQKEQKDEQTEGSIQEDSIQENKTDSENEEEDKQQMDDLEPEASDNVQQIESQNLGNSQTIQD